MNQYEVTLPNLGDDMTEEAIVSLWFAEEGSILNEGDDLVEVTTDKAAFTVPCPKTGTMLERFKEENETVRPDEVLCVLEIV